MKNLPQVKDLLEAGVHFGHQTKRWNPKMAKYIYTTKNDIHIIDLYKTLENLDIALNFLEEKAIEGDVLFVGTKRQAQEVVEEIAKRINAPFVTNRWVGGLLTNWTVTKKNINKMLDIEDKMVNGFENRTKQEILLIKKELDRLQRLYSGVRSLKGKPAVIVLADPKHERIAMKEAQKLNIPIVALVDTNCDPDEVNYVIPGNDDAIKSITLFFNLFAETTAEGMSKRKAIKVEDPKKDVQKAAPVKLEVKLAKKPEVVVEAVKELKTEESKTPVAKIKEPKTQVEIKKEVQEATPKAIAKKQASTVKKVVKK